MHSFVVRIARKSTLRWKMKMKMKVAGMSDRVLAFGMECCAIVMMLLCPAMGHATIIQGQFSGTINQPGVPFAGSAGGIFTGTYTYDDTVASTGPAPGALTEAIIYPALSFEIDGIPVGSNPAIWIMDGTPVGTRDFFGVLVQGSVCCGSTGFPMLTMGDPDGSLWSTEDLSNLNGRVFADFDGGTVATSLQLTGAWGTVTSWSHTAIPEPGTAVLMLVGLLGLGGRRGRASDRFEV